MSSKESKIYLVLLALAYVAFNVGMFIFSAQHVIKNFGSDKGSLDPIHFTGMAVHTHFVQSQPSYSWHFE